MDHFRVWVGIATLRSLEIDLVPEELRAEPLNSLFLTDTALPFADRTQGLVIRVLHRLRFLSEQAPFDTATFSYAFSLLAQVLTLGGVTPGDDDEALEQVALALDIIKFHCAECRHVSLPRYVLLIGFSSVSDAAFPRKQTMEILLHIIRQQPKLSKEASSTLVDLGEAVHSNASRGEIDVLLKGTLMQEVYVRNSCLQTLQVCRRFFARLVTLI